MNPFFFLRQLMGPREMIQKLGRSQLVVSRAKIRHEPQLPFQFFRFFCEIMSVDPDLAASALLQTRNGAHGGGFARPIGANQTADITTLNR